MRQRILKTLPQTKYTSALKEKKNNKAYIHN